METLTSPEIAQRLGMTYDPTDNEHLYPVGALGDWLGVPHYTIQRAARSGALDAEYHDGITECDPANPCVLAADTVGHHYVATPAAAHAWASNRRSPRPARLVPAQVYADGFRAGWLAALDAIEQAFVGEQDDTGLPTTLDYAITFARQEIPVPEVYPPAGRVE